MNSANNLGITRIVSTPQTEDEVSTKGRDRVVEHWSSIMSNAHQYDVRDNAPLYYHPEDDIPNGKSTQQHN